MSKQFGMASFKAVVAVGLFVVLVYLGIKLVPPWVNNYQLQDYLTTLVRKATYAQGITEEGIRRDVLTKTKELRMPVKGQQIRVVKSTYGVNIDVKYNVVVKTPAYTFNLKFNPTAGNKMIAAR